MGSRSWQLHIHERPLQRERTERRFLLPHGHESGRENEIILFKSCFPNSHLGGSPDDPASSLCTYPERDCDDEDAEINPGATEDPPGDPTCSDAFDNDCDGSADGATPPCGVVGSGFGSERCRGSNPMNAMIMLLLPMGIVSLLRFRGGR